MGIFIVPCSYILGPLEIISEMASFSEFGAAPLFYGTSFRWSSWHRIKLVLKLVLALVLVLVLVLALVLALALAFALVFVLVLVLALY